MRREVIEVREGYGIEKWYYEFGEVFEGSEPAVMVVAVNSKRHYIGSPEDAKYLVEDRGIAPELRTETSQTCSIGFCTREQKWYGWSHRALMGFGIGDEVEVGSVIESFGSGFRAQTLEDARLMAEAFAESVS